MTQGTAMKVEREVRIDARPETVFEFFTDAEKMTRWMGQDAELDARPGGALRVDVSPEWRALGEFVELEPPRRLVFTWGWESGMAIAPGASTVEVTLEAEAGGTRLRLVHSDIPTEESRANHEHGWELYTGRLVIAAAGGDPGPDPQGIN